MRIISRQSFFKQNFKVLRHNNLKKFVKQESTIEHLFIEENELIEANIISVKNMKSYNFVQHEEELSDSYNFAHPNSNLID